MIKIQMLGACSEVGRSAFKVADGNGTEVILDYGIAMRRKDNLPLDVEPKNISGAILSHAHVDHSAALPSFYISASPNCFMTYPTRDLARVLLKDTLRISGQWLPYEMLEVNKFLKSAKTIDYQKIVRTKSFSFQFIDAGHIPGSAMILLSINNKKILYTGDLNTRDTRLLWSAKTDNIPPLDSVIIESTYAKVKHPPRLEVEQEFITAIKHILARKGKVLIPAFGVARSQEVLSILQSYGLTNLNIVIDGMVREISRLLLKYPDYLRTVFSLENVKFIKKSGAQFSRSTSFEKADIIIAPSGMMRGGPVRYYAPKILEDERNGLFLVSYQVEGTPGQILLDEKKYFLDDGHIESEAEDIASALGNSIEVNAEVKQFDFSSHCDGDDLVHFLENLKFSDDNNETKIFCIHGDKDNCEHLANRLNESDVCNGATAIAPKLGEEFSI
ncbi:MAG: MBL fold metallo-hydrolase [Promethearchaeota archaeon]